MSGGGGGGVARGGLERLLLLGVSCVRVFVCVCPACARRRPPRWLPLRLAAAPLASRYLAGAPNTPLRTSHTPLLSLALPRSPARAAFCLLPPLLPAVQALPPDPRGHTPLPRPACLPCPPAPCGPWGVSLLAGSEGDVDLSAFPGPVQP